MTAKLVPSAYVPLHPVVTTAKVWLCPTSGSLAPRVPMTVPDGWFSGTVLLESVMSVGASLTLVTVMVKDFSKKLPDESVVRTRIE